MPVARISSTQRDGTFHVSITGTLGAKDLRRLERHCGPALEHARLALEIRLRGVTRMDESARMYLHRLEGRGAVIHVQQEA